MYWAIPADDNYFKPILEQTPEGFELDHLVAALEYCNSFRFAVDGGAHIGTWAVALAKRFKQVIAFEPATDTFSCLVSNTYSLPNVNTIHAALGEVEGVCVVVNDPTRKGNTGSRTIQVASPQTMSGPHVVMNRLDSYHFTQLDFLKLDVEGSEPLALRGATETIERCRPVIMVECKAFTPPRNGGPEATRQVLTNLGYGEVGGIRNDRVFLPL